MARSKVTEPEWAHARRFWETTPRATFGEVAEMLGVSRQAVQKRAAKEGWKKGADMHAVAKKAHEVADSVSYREQQEAEKAASEEVRARALQIAEEIRQKNLEEAEKTAIELRARLLEMHRKEWSAVRKIVHGAISRSDFEMAKLGKIVSEATRIIQDGERRAWGLDVENENSDSGEVRVVVERRDMRL